MDAVAFSSSAAILCTIPGLDIQAILRGMKRLRSLLCVSLLFGCHWFGKKADSYDDGGVFDAKGKRHDCRRGMQSCEKVREASDDFSDACGKAGYRIVRCGCADYCTGNPVETDLHFDKKNRGKDCAPPKESCELGESSGAFQDACTDMGGKLVQCGCEWLCTRKLKGPVDDTPAPDEPADAGAPPSDDEAKDKEKE